MADASELFRVLLDNTDFIAWITDVDGVIRLSEGKGLRGMGLEPGQMVGTNLRELYAEGSPALRNFARACAGETFVTKIEQDGRVYESRYAPVRDEGGAVASIVGISTDVTEPVRAVQALEQATRALKRQADLLNMADDAILARGVDGTISYWNLGAAKLYGYSAAEALGRSSHALLKTEFPRPLDEIEAQLRRDGTWQGEVVHTTREGRRLVVLTRWALRAEAEGEVILEISTDITQRKRETEEQLRREQVIRAQSEAIQELSTPLIPITDEILVMPLVGLMDSMRAKQVMSALLEGLAASRGKVAILDVTGISVVDTQVADALIRAAHAARLLGAEVILTGIRPEVAQVLVGLEADLGPITTMSSLQSGIRHALGGRSLSAALRR